MAKRRKQNRLPETARAVLLGIGIAAAATLVLLLCCAKLIHAGTIPEDAMQVCGMLISIICCTLSALVATRQTRRRYLPIAMGAAAGYLALLMLLNICIIPEGFRNLPLILAAGFGASVAIGLLPQHGRKRKFG